MINDIINKIENATEIVFAEVDACFNEPKDLLDYHPEKEGWSIRKILEHISLTNHFLLILIRKATVKALEKAKLENYNELLTGYDLDWEKLKQIGEHKSFYWNRPQHMEPTGTADLYEIKRQLHLQKTACLNYLNQLKNGEGVLYKTTMSVNELGKIDVYHYIYFLVQHARRHLTQMQKNRNEFEQHL
ncbi:hypothetical protein BH11BAC5_BH11BAC5_05360 [soil metagenome]